MKRLVLPRVVRHVDEYRFIFPAVAWAHVRATPGVSGALFSIAVGWWRWHVEFIWQNSAICLKPATTKEPTPCA